MHPQLDADIRAGQIDGCIADSTQKQDVDLLCCFEQVIDLHSLLLGDLAMNIGHFQLLCVVF